jgi:hypothetical protein
MNVQYRVWDCDHCRHKAELRQVVDVDSVETDWRPAYEHIRDAHPLVWQRNDALRAEASLAGVA